MSAWHVGAATVTPVVEIETVTSPRFLFDDLDKAGVLAIVERSPWLSPHFVDDKGYLLQVIQCLVVEVDGRRIAVDTCVGNHKPRGNPGWNDLHLPFLDDMAAAGFPPESIDTVVCTHLHVDHVGWNTRLVDGRWVPTFPDARYVFAATEFEYWKVTEYEGGDDIFGDSVQPVVDAGLADLVPDDHQVSPSVRLDPTPGHTPGHVAVVIESDGQRAVITGDMMHTPLQVAEVHRSSRFDYDRVASAETRQKFLARYCDGPSGPPQRADRRQGPQAPGADRGAEAGADQQGTLVIGTHWGGPGAGRIVAEGEGRWSIAVE